MKVGDAKAKAGGGLKSAGRGVHTDGRGCEWIFGRKYQGAPILTVFIWGFWGAGEYVMPSNYRIRRRLWVTEISSKGLTREC